VNRERTECQETTQKNSSESVRVMYLKLIPVLFILASHAVTFLNPRLQYSVFMLGSVNTVLP